MRPLALAVLILLPRLAFAADTLPAPQKVKQLGADNATAPNIQSNNTAPGAGGGQQVLTLDTESSAPTCTAGRLCMPWGDTAGRMHIVNDLALTMDITKIGGSTPGATNALAVQITDGASFNSLALKSQFPASLGRTTMAASTSVTIASDQAAIPVTQGAPTGATTVRAAPSSLASGAGPTTFTCKGSLATVTTFKIARVRMTSVGYERCTVQTNNNAAITTYADLITDPYSPRDEISPTYGFISFTTGASGTQAIELSCTSFDSQAADIGCDVSYGQ